MRKIKALKPLAHAIGIVAITWPVTFAAIAKDHPKVTKAQATKAVLAKLPNAKIVSSELESESGQNIWSFDVKDGGATKEVWVDSKTGEVSKVDVETKAAEKVEKRMDKAEALVKRKTKGEVINSTTEGKGKNETYIFDVKIKDGSTKQVRVNAKTLKIQK